MHGRVFDVGCGDMPYRSLILSKARDVRQYVGIDLQQSGYCPPNVVWDGHTLPFACGQADVVLAMEVLEHCFDPRALLAEAHRVLKANGTLFVTVPFLWPLHCPPNDFYRYTPWALERHLRQAGFADVALRSLGGWDASLAQMLGLWVSRRPMKAMKRRVLQMIVRPCVRHLTQRDPLLSLGFHDEMLSGLSAVARKRTW